MLVIAQTSDMALLNELYQDFISNDPKYFLYNELHPLDIGTKFNIIPPTEKIIEVCGGIDFNLIDIDRFEKWLEWYLIADNIGFIQFMIPMMGYYYNNNVIVLTPDNSYLATVLMDCFTSLILHRYGMVCPFISNLEELYDVFEYNDYSMTPEGLYTFGCDKERMTYLVSDPKELRDTSEVVDRINAGCI